VRDPKERLRGILDAIARIERYAARGSAAFDSDERTQVVTQQRRQIRG